MKANKEDVQHKLRLHKINTCAVESITSITTVTTAVIRADSIVAIPILMAHVSFLHAFIDILREIWNFNHLILLHFSYPYKELRKSHLWLSQTEININGTKINQHINLCS